MDAAAAVIVGGGVVGCSIAYHLAAAGLRDVVVVERDAPASGSTGRATGAARTLFAHPANVRMSRLSIDFLARADDLLGDDCDYEPVGYVFLARPESAGSLRGLVESQRQAGLPAQWLEPPDLRDLVPGLRVDDLAGGVFSPLGGTFDPARLNRALARRAQELGVRFLTGTEVTAVASRGGRVAGVATSRGSVSAGVVVLAAGVWSAAVAATAGIDLPVWPLRRQLCVTAPSHGPAFPVTVEPLEGLVLRRREGGILFGVSRSDEPPGFTPGVDEAWNAHARARAAHRLPVLAGLPVARCWAGYYEMSPDHNALIGPHPDLQGLIVATGFSGHGVMHAPATGMAVAELILHGSARSLDIHPYRPERFREGRPFAGELVF